MLSTEHLIAALMLANLLEGRELMSDIDGVPVREGECVRGRECARDRECLRVFVCVCVCVCPLDLPSFSFSAQAIIDSGLGDMLQTVGVGKMIGELALISQLESKPSRLQMTAIALDATAVLRIGKEEYRQCLQVYRCAPLRSCLIALLRNLRVHASTR